MAEYYEYQGLSQTDINILVSFMYVWQKDVKDINKQADFKESFPKSFSFFKQELYKLVAYEKSGNLNENGPFDVSESKQQTYKLLFTKKTGYCQINKLCFHIRNAFAHGRIYVEGDVVYITDKSKDSWSCLGALPKDKCFDFLSSLSKEVGFKLKL